MRRASVLWPGGKRTIMQETDVGRRKHALPWFVVAVAVAAIAVFWAVTPRGDAYANRSAQTFAHSVLPEGVKSSLAARGESSAEPDKVEALLRGSSAAEITQYSPHVEVEVGARDGETIPVSFYYYREEPDLNLSLVKNYGWGIACVEYEVGEEWAIHDVPCGKKARERMNHMGPA